MSCATGYFSGFFSLMARKRLATPIFLPTSVPAVEPPIASTRGRVAAASLSPAVSFE